MIHLKKNKVGSEFVDIENNTSIGYHIRFGYIYISHTHTGVMKYSQHSQETVPTKHSDFWLNLIKWKFANTPVSTLLNLFLHLP